MTQEPQTVGGREQKARVEARAATEAKKQRRIWCCYQADGSGFVLFGAELHALRYMAERHMDGCKAVEFGVPLQEQIG